MKNVEAMLNAITKDALLGYVKELLRQRDREFAGLEAAFRSAVERMGGLEEMLQLRDWQLNCDLWFAAGQGMKLNLENFRSPLGTVLMKMDYTDLLREHIMMCMPGHGAAEKQVADMLKDMTAQQREELEPVDEYYAHLETMGLKIAHYLGLRLGDLLLPMVEPGYVRDTAALRSYRYELERFMEFKLN